MDKAVCLLSGGIDSTVLLHYLLAQNYDVTAISFDYGQRFKKELDYAKEICQHLKVRHLILKIPLFKGNTILLNRSSQVPEGRFKDLVKNDTIIPNRNMIMLAIAGSCAVGLKADTLAMAAHRGDIPFFPDCTPAFFNTLEKAFRVGLNKKIKIYTPFLFKSKVDILRIGKEMGVDFERTWTCYKGGKVSCGKCPSCVERREALREVGL